MKTEINNSNGNNYYIENDTWNLETDIRQAQLDINKIISELQEKHKRFVFTGETTARSHGSLHWEHTTLIHIVLPTK
jgi:hypothetical protein